MLHEHHRRQHDRGNETRNDTPSDHSRPHRTPISFKFFASGRELLKISIPRSSAPWDAAIARQRGKGFAAAIIENGTKASTLLSFCRLYDQKVSFSPVLLGLAAVINLLQKSAPAEEQAPRQKKWHGSLPAPHAA